MAAKLIRLTHKLAIQVYRMAESCTICSSRFRRPIRELLDTPSYIISSVWVYDAHCLENEVDDSMYIKHSIHLTGVYNTCVQLLSSIRQSRAGSPSANTKYVTFTVFLHSFVRTRHRILLVLSGARSDSSKPNPS
jgi:hypothetical protein